VRSVRIKERVAPEGSVADGARRATKDRPVHAVTRGVYRGCGQIEAPPYTPAAGALARLVKGPRSQRYRSYGSCGGERQDKIQQLRG
jgi:hypothetical protein